MIKSTSYPLGTLTVAHLRAKGACMRQQRLFKQIFPEGFTPTRENFVKAGTAGLQIWWALSMFVTDDSTRYSIVRLKNHRRYDSPSARWNNESLEISYALAWWSILQKQVKELAQKQSR